MPGVDVTGPDGKEYEFPDGTDKAAAIKYFRAKGIGVPKSSAIAPPKMTVGAPSTQPVRKVYYDTGNITPPEEPHKSPLEEVGELASGALKSTGYLAAMAPTAIHHTLQKAGIMGERSRLFPGEHTMGEIKREDLPNAVATVAGGLEMGEEPKPSAATPRGRTVPEPPRGVADLDPESQAKYTAALDKANKAHGEALADHAVKEAEARAKWVDKAASAKRSASSAEAATNKRATLERGSQEYTRLTHDNLQQTYKAARGSLDQRWGQFRSAMEGEQLDPIRAYESIENAKAKYLKGSPSSLKVFNDLANEIGIQKINEEGEVITPKGENGEPVEVELPFDTARVHYSALGDKLSTGTLPGNVYQALKAVSEDLDEQLTDAADGRGLGKEYQSLKANEHQFRSDWKDRHSPLAKAYNAQDPNFLAGHVTGKGADLMMKQLARYREFGAKPYLPAAARRLSLEAEAVPRVRVSEAPSKYKAPAKPELKSVERPIPKTAKPEVKGTHKIVRAGRRMALKLGGAKIGGFPGYLAGGEIDNAIEARVRQRQQTVEPPPDE